MIEAQVARRVEEAANGQRGAQQGVRGHSVQERLQAGLPLGHELGRHVADEALRGQREVRDAERAQLAVERCELAVPVDHLIRDSGRRSIRVCCQPIHAYYIFLGTIRS